ncbi:MAG: hypothetical protein U0O04_07815 [Clostridia bacterium]
MSIVHWIKNKNMIYSYQMNGCGHCPQYVHVREILVVQVIS